MGIDTMVLESGSSPAPTNASNRAQLVGPDYGTTFPLPGLTGFSPTGKFRYGKN